MFEHRQNNEQVFDAVNEAMQVLRENEARQHSDAKRYQEIYGFDLNDTSIYDLTLNSDDQTPEALAQTIQARAAERFGHEVPRGAGR